MIWHINELLLFMLMLFLFVTALEIGFRMGRSSNTAQDPDIDEHNNSLQSATLVLLALLLGFTFSMAVSRYDNRKEILLEEANSIGTTYLRSKFLPTNPQQDTGKLLKNYVKARLDFFNAGNDPQKIEIALRTTNELQNRLWSQALTLAAQQPTSLPFSLYVQSLNDLIDDSEKRRAAQENHVPDAVIILLLGVSTVSLGLVAYGCGIVGQRRWGMNSIFTIMIALVILIILDIDRPRRGMVQISQNSMLRLYETIKADVPDK